MHMSATPFNRHPLKAAEPLSDTNKKILAEYAQRQYSRLANIPLFQGEASTLAQGVEWIYQWLPGSKDVGSAAGSAAQGQLREALEKGISAPAAVTTQFVSNEVGSAVLGTIPAVVSSAAPLLGGLVVHGVASAGRLVLDYASTPKLKTSPFNFEGQIRHEGTHYFDLRGDEWSEWDVFQVYRGVKRLELATKLFGTTRGGVQMVVYYYTIPHTNGSQGLDGKSFTTDQLHIIRHGMTALENENYMTDETHFLIEGMIEALTAHMDFGGAIPDTNEFIDEAVML